MKKIIRGIVLGVLGVVVIAASVAAYFLFFNNSKPDVSKQIVTDAKGNSYLAMVDEKSGETLVAVTDANGKIYAAVTDANGNVGNTVGSVDDVVKISDLPTNYTGPDINVSVNGSDYRGDVDSTTQPADSTTQSNASTSPNNSSPSNSNSATESTTKANNGKLTAYRIAKYQKVFAGGTFLMEFTTADEELGDTPITVAVKNGNVYMETEFQGMSMKFLCLAGSGSKKGTNYVIIDKYKKYCKIPDDMMGDVDFSSVVDNFGGEIDKKITVSKVTVGGKELICESYVDDDGTVVKYFFDGETLVRRDNVSKDGKTDTTYISKLSTDVPDSLFEIPDNYGFLNLSFLSGLSGIGSN